MIPFRPVSGAGEDDLGGSTMVTRRRIVALMLGLAALTPSLSASPASASNDKATLYAGSCQLTLILHFTEPIGFASFGRPNYSIEVWPFTGTPACQIAGDRPDPWRSTTVTANGSSDIFSCSAAVAAGGWSQWFQDSQGNYTPMPVVGGQHKLYGTYDNWVMELEGPNVLNFLGAINLRVHPLSIESTAAACTSGSLWDLQLIGTQVFEDPQP